MTNLLLAVIYLAFISMGLPDGLLGSAWPTMGGDLHAPLSRAGGISMTISAGTIISALLSDRLTLRFGAGRVTAFSVALTAAALMGFSFAPNYWVLIVCAIPYGLGAGGVDAALNNYVAIHYTSRHMSWLHCMWGLGALIGPYMMSYAMASRHGWQWGYRSVGVIQLVLTAVLIFSLPLWKRRPAAADAGTQATDRKPIGLLGVLRISGATQILIMFFCYCAIEQTAMLWASSYMVGMDGMAEDVAATFTSIFLIGITVGRFANGFLTMRFSDPAMIRIGTMTIGPRGAPVARSRAQPRPLRRAFHARRLDALCLSVHHHSTAHTYFRADATFAGDRRCADGVRVCGHHAHATIVRRDRASHDDCRAAMVSAGVRRVHGGDARVAARIATRRHGRLTCS